jgi:hypothetical protein
MLDRPNVRRQAVQRKPVRRRSRNEQTPRYVVAVDLGFVRDPTALVVVERVERADYQANGAVEGRARFDILDLKRFPLRTPFPVIIDDICRLMAWAPLKDQTGLIVDATGLGLPITQEMQRSGLRPVPITITGGSETKGLHVPKQALLARMLLLLEQKRFGLARDLDLAAELRQEFANFTVRLTANGKATYSASSGQHDDLIIALCLAVHFFECRRRVPLVHATVISSPVARSSVRFNLARAGEEGMLSRWLKL